MDFRHLIVTCLFSKLRLPFDNQKVKENYAIFPKNTLVFQSLFKFHSKALLQQLIRTFPLPNPIVACMFSAETPIIIKSYFRFLSCTFRILLITCRSISSKSVEHTIILNLLTQNNHFRGKRKHAFHFKLSFSNSS